MYKYRYHVFFILENSESLFSNVMNEEPIANNPVRME
jgi:hypothetical protein